MNIFIRLLAVAALCISSAAHATVIDFDDLDASNKLSSIGKYNPYDSITWSNSWYLGPNTYAGYDNGAHSGTQFLLNGFGANNLSFRSASTFDFVGAWFAVPNINGSRATWINVSAYDQNDALIGSTGNIGVSNTYAFVEANFSNASRITVSRDKGFFIMDDVTLGEPASVPEPGAVALIALALAGLTVSRRRR